MKDMSLPRSLAVAGGWGYIGRHFVDAAAALDIAVYVRDPGPIPTGIDLDRVEVIGDDDSFYSLPADFYHIALHPTNRKAALRRLADRLLRGDRFMVLNEKPMAAPEFPGECMELRQLVDAAGMCMFFDFPELFDPMTLRVREFLRSFKEVRIDKMRMTRSKDREDPANPRNYKIMVPIQHQETVHCLAWVFTCLAETRGGLDHVWDQGLSVEGWSSPYHPPNPEAYPYTVDGRFEGSVRFGDCLVHLTTDFTADAPRTKRRTVRGVGDGKPFVIEAEYLEGHKFLAIDGKDVGFAQDANVYQAVIRQGWRWYQHPDLDDAALHPTPGFAHRSYLLSAMLWDACHLGKPRQVSNLQEFMGYTPGFVAPK
jgi:predicted dehydrogenase